MTYGKQDAPLIGLMGYATAGKDALADSLVKHYGYRKVSLSDPINAMLMALDPIIEAGPRTLVSDQDGYVLKNQPLIRYREYVERHGYTAAKQHPEVRALLQRMGTEAGRKVLGETVWVEQMLMTIWRSPNPCVVTNVRYREEAEAIRGEGGILVLVTRPGVGPTNDHVSEQIPATPDLVVANDGTLEDLEAKAHELMAPYIPALTR